jgi:hypothetical protein
LEFQGFSGWENGATSTLSYPRFELFRDFSTYKIILPENSLTSGVGQWCSKKSKNEAKNEETERRKNIYTNSNNPSSVLYLPSPPPRKTEFVSRYRCYMICKIFRSNLKWANEG